MTNVANQPRVRGGRVHVWRLQGGIRVLTEAASTLVVVDDGLYASDLLPLARALEAARMRDALEVDLAYALHRRELEVFYQPIVNLETAFIAGFEALLRWRHPVRGLVMPLEFIPIAEESGLIIPIGAWVLERACLQLQAWQQRHPRSPALSMNVNLSVKQLQDPRLTGRIEELLAQTGIHPETLKLELTESTFIGELESARHVLCRLREMGIGVKLDDFGTGYSSLSYLRNLPFEALKIDRSFVAQMDTDCGTRAIVETIVGLAKALDMQVVAEGIESESQRAGLLGMGCRTGQGFLFSKPVPAEAAECMLMRGAHCS